jgi:hypothetical protein
LIVCGNVCRSSSVNIGDEINRIKGGDVEGIGLETKEDARVDEVSDMDAESDDEIGKDEAELTAPESKVVFGPVPKIDSVDVKAIFEFDSCFRYDESRGLL